MMKFLLPFGSHTFSSHCLWDVLPCRDVGRDLMLKVEDEVLTFGNMQDHTVCLVLNDAEEENSY